MLRKTLLAIGLLATLSATAQAGSTISDKSYWPNEAKRSAQSRTDDAFAYDRSGSAQQPSTDAGARAWRYQGGPKSR